MNSGIYKIENLKNGHIYIGSATNLNGRKNTHFFSLRRNKHKNKHLQSAFNLYGEDNFVFVVLEYCEIKDLINREQFYIDNLRPEYNMCPVALSPIGIKRSEAFKKKDSEMHRGVLAWNFGKHLSEEHKEHLKKSRKGQRPMLGKHHSEETRKKLSEIHKGKTPWNKGKKCPQISEGLKKFYKLQKGVKDDKA